MFDSIHEECGVFGIYEKENTNIASSVYYGLYALQHRGQESCGIAVCKDGLIEQTKGFGLVNDVFNKDNISKLNGGNMAVGHVRYSTTGGNNTNNIQPLVIQHNKGNLALAHNGNLTNAFELRKNFESNGAIFHGTSDTESICYTIVKERISSHSIEEAIRKTMSIIKGAYSCIAMSSTKSMTGHLLGGAGSVEAVFSLLALNNNVMPPTLNLDDPEEEAKGVNLVPHVAQERNLNVVLSNSFGFGGTNACLIFKKV